MATITTNDGTEIFYKDWGSKDAQLVVFHHGWPLSSDDWDNQMLFFLAEGFRVIAHDRRGHPAGPETPPKPPVSNGPAEQTAPDAGEIEWAGQVVKKPPAPDR